MPKDAVSYDVVVAGGGAAGVGAAVGAALTGARTLLIESAGCLGGAATLKCVQTYCGLYTIGDIRVPSWPASPRQSSRSFARSAAQRPMKFRGVFLVIDSEAVKFVLDDVCLAAGVDVLLHATVVRAERSGSLIHGITYHDHNGDHDVLGKAFVDASGDCDLAFFAGASTRYGNHGFINLGTLGTRFGGIKPDADLSAETWTAAIRKARGEGVSRCRRTSRSWCGCRCGTMSSPIWQAKRMTRVTPKASAGRRSGAGGKLGRISTSSEPSKDVKRPIWRSTGCIRHAGKPSRRLHASVEGSRCVAAARFNKSIALGAWGMEFHSTEPMDSTFKLPGGNGVYEIPLGAVTSVDPPNLFAAGRTADGDQMAGASLRVMGTAFATGQGCGVAAAQYAHKGNNDVAAMRKCCAGRARWSMVTVCLIRLPCYGPEIFLKRRSAHRRRHHRSVGVDVAAVERRIRSAESRRTHCRFVSARDAGRDDTDIAARRPDGAFAERDAPGSGIDRHQPSPQDPVGDRAIQYHSADAAVGSTETVVAARNEKMIVRMRYPLAEKANRAKRT